MDGLWQGEKKVGRASTDRAGTHSLRQIGHRPHQQGASARSRTALEKQKALSAERVGWEPSLLLG
jgi:hypothetical protein